MIVFITSIGERSDVGITLSTMDLNLEFSGPLKNAFSKLVDLELKAYFTYENMETYYAKQVAARNAFAEYFRRVKLAHRERAKDLMTMARRNGWPFHIKLNGLVNKNHNWGHARFAFAEPKRIEREILDAVLLLSGRANQFYTTEVISITDRFLHDQNLCLADINLNLARLTRCNSFKNETIFNSYLEYILANDSQFVGVSSKTKNEEEKPKTNESGFEEEEDDDDQWTDIDDEEEEGELTNK